MFKPTCHLTAALILISGLNVFAQTAAEPVIENNRIRVVAHKIAPGENAELDAQPPFFAFALNHYSAEAYFDPGDRITWESRFEDLRWFDRPLQKIRNTGDRTAEVLVVEIKPRQSNSAFVVAADDGTKIAPRQYAVTFENDRIRVLRATLAPGEKTPMHSHQGSAFRYSLTEGEKRFRFTSQDGTTREQVVKGRGGPQWTAGPSRHSTENIGAIGLYVLVVEVK